MVWPVPFQIELAEERLRRLLGLSPDQARRAVGEVVDCLSRTVDEYVIERHGELRSRGLPNSSIYRAMTRELPRLRFAAPQLTERQLRRRIYG